MNHNLLYFQTLSMIELVGECSKKYIPYVPIPSIKNLDYFSVNTSIKDQDTFTVWNSVKYNLCHEWDIKWQWGMIISWFNKMEFYQRVKQKLADELEAESPLEYPEGKIIWIHHIGKSFSEVLILASSNPSYDKRLSSELPVQYMKIPSSEHGRTWGEHVAYINCSECQNKNNLCAQHVLPMFWACSFQFSYIELVNQWTICCHIVG